MYGLSRTRGFLVALFFVLLAALWATRGIHDDKEALKYIGCARDLLRGDAHDLVGRYKAYASYVLFLLPSVALGAPELAVIAQAVLAVLAAFALARLVERLSGSARAGTIALALALLCYPLQEWVLALYTESFFVSIAVLFLERATRPGRTPWTVFLLGAVLLFARPNGILFVLPALIWEMREPFQVPQLLRPAACAAMLLLVAVLPGVPREHLGVIVEGHVICGFPERPGALEDFHGTTILAAQRALFQEPAYAAGLFLRRAASLFTLTRPYYSAGHNRLLMPFYLLFVLAAVGWWRWKADTLAGLFLTVVLLNVVLIGLTYDEWNGRFLVPLWPLIIAFAATGMNTLVGRFAGGGAWAFKT